MRSYRFLLSLLLLVPAFFSCNKDLKIDATWKDITVVYGLLDQSSDTTFIKITKAFLGPGDALQFARIPDSSNYPDKLDVRLVEYSGTDSLKSFLCDTVTIHNKDKGDSIFYYPDQLMYYTKALLNQDHTYKLVIRNKQTGKLITGETQLVHRFDIASPQIQTTVGFQPSQTFNVNFSSAKNGIRYQLTIRFYYQEWPTADTTRKQMKYVDWVVFDNLRASDPTSTSTFNLYIPGKGFFARVGAAVDTTTVLSRYPHHCKYIFSVASSDLNTYMEVTEPSTTVVQEKPPFTNITNGIGLFSSRFTNVVDSLTISTMTRAYLQSNPLTAGRGFLK